MNFHGSRALKRSLGVFSAFAGGGRQIFGEFSFAESYSSDDFESVSQFTAWVKPYLDQVGRPDLTWTPPDMALRNRATNAWDEWTKAAMAGSQTAINYINDIRAQMQGLIAAADSASVNQRLGKRSESVEAQRYDTFNQIVTVINQVANSLGQAKAARVAATAGAAYVPGDTTSGGADSSQGAASAGQLVTSGSVQQHNPLAQGGSHTTLIVVLGGVALLIGGAVLLRRRRSSMSGYKRRRR